MATPRVLLVRAPGTNCDEETAFAWTVAKGSPQTQHIHSVLNQPQMLSGYQILCLPGGFSYGDDIAAGRILASQLSGKLGDALRTFRDTGKLILGICNGFQVLMRTGMLFAEAEAPQQAAPATLTWNLSGRFEDRWVQLSSSDSPCVFLQGIDHLTLPIAHAEGRFVARDIPTLEQFQTSGQLVLRYSLPPEQDRPPSADNAPIAGESILPYPHNPNGSQGNVAGLCDATGRVLGLMPHPERFVDFTQHPCWTRRTTREAGDGLALFQNAVRFFR